MAKTMRTLRSFFVAGSGLLRGGTTGRLPLPENTARPAAASSSCRSAEASFVAAGAFTARGDSSRGRACALDENAAGSASKTFWKTTRPAAASRSARSLDASCARTGTARDIEMAAKTRRRMARLRIDHLSGISRVQPDRSVDVGRGGDFWVEPMKAGQIDPAF